VCQGKSGGGSRLRVGGYEGMGGAPFHGKRSPKKRKVLHKGEKRDRKAFKELGRGEKRWFWKGSRSNNNKEEKQSRDGGKVGVGRG